MHAVLFLRTSGMTSTADDGTKTTRYRLVSIMKDMKPSTRVTPDLEVNHHRTACDKAFALAYQYSGGRDLMEEMVALKCWPLGKNRSPFKLEKVKLPVFSEEDGVPFPRFNIKLSEDEIAETFVSLVEQEARVVASDISDHKYLA